MASTSTGTTGFEVLVASALTHIHIGIGRSPGVVDLPVVRDPLGYPYLPGQSLKGALKTMLARQKHCLTSDGRVNCSKNGCRKLCCIFGGEPGDTDATGAVTITDFYPLLVPVASLDKGVVYVTSPMLVSRAKALVELAKNRCWLGELVEGLNGIIDSGEDIVVISTSSGAGETKDIYLYNRSYKARVKRLEATQQLQQILDGLGQLNPVYKKLDIVNGRIVIVPEHMAKTIIEKSLVRLTRIRLKRTTKTVETGGLWTEEYLPHTTLFVGAFHDTGFRGKYCNDVNNALESLQDILRESIVREGTFSLVVGGKETVGKGLLRFIKPCSPTNSKGKQKQ